MHKTLPKIKFIRHNEERLVEKFLKALGSGLIRATK
jgi:hypothetical protein